MSRYFNEELLERIKNANDIVSVLSEYMTLQKKGQKYWGCCPFHNEKTPSFSVSPDKGFYYCFGCRAAGNVFKFLMQHENISFPDAVERLAQRVGIDLPETVQSPRAHAEAKHIEKIFEANALASDFFHSCLVNSSVGAHGLSYLQSRGLSQETITMFKLGFAPNDWGKLYNALNGRGIADEVLVDAGLCRRSEKGNRIYDYFRNRVMFPILDGRGRVVGFGGRVMDDSTPKYLNTSETKVFNKGHLLFAFDKAYRTIREKKQAILVEGYMDVISAHNRGVTNVVASLGTAFTLQQSQLLIRQANEIILAYDMDSAGQEATRKAIELTQNMDYKVRIASMPDGKDPDDFIRNHGPKAFLNIVQGAITPFEFLLNKALVSHGSTSLEAKLNVLNAVFPFVLKTNEAIRREGYLKALSLPLRLSVRDVVSYFDAFQRKSQVGKKQQNASQAVEKPNTQNQNMAYQSNGNENVEMTDPLEGRLLAIAFSNTEALSVVEQYVKEDFRTPIYKDMLKKALHLLSEKKSMTLTDLETLFTEEENRELSRIMVEFGAMHGEDVLYGHLRALKLQSLRNQYSIHSSKADRLSRAGDSKYYEELAHCVELQKQIKEWSS